LSIRLAALILLTVILAAAAAPVFADRAILTPTGATLATGRFRAEAAFRPDETDTRLYWAAVGISRVEIEGQRAETGAGHEDMANVELSVMPQTLLTPALGVGVMDVSDEIERSYYAAVTKAIPLSSPLPLPVKDVRVTVGLGSGRFDGFFASAEGQVAGFRLQAEYDGDDFNAAIGLPFLNVVTAKAMWIEDDFYVGIELKPRF
jgi:hypothetical protein